MMRMTRDTTRLDSARGKSKFGATMFEPEVFRKQIYCIEESTCGIVGLFSALHRDSATHSDSGPGEFCPPSLRPCVSPVAAPST